MGVVERIAKKHFSWIVCSQKCCSLDISHGVREKGNIDKNSYWMCSKKFDQFPVKKKVLNRQSKLFSPGHLNRCYITNPFTQRTSQNTVLRSVEHITCSPWNRKINETNYFLFPSTHPRTSRVFICVRTPSKTLVRGRHQFIGAERIKLALEKAHSLGSLTVGSGRRY